MSCVGSLREAVANLQSRRRGRNRKVTVILEDCGPRDRESQEESQNGVAEEVHTQYTGQPSKKLTGLGKYFADSRRQVLT